MELNLITVEDFYSNVDEVREFALSQPFDVKGNYPGQRTISYANESIKETIGNILRPYSGEITHFPMGQYDSGDGTTYEPDPEASEEERYENYNGAFQYTTATDRTWIHCDHWNSWAAVIYLTPDAPLTGGTGLYKHKSTGLYRTPLLPDGSINEDIMDGIWKEANDYTKWDLVDFVHNKYNRMVIYRGDMFHASLDYFGKDMFDGRLFQTFFFNTEY
jgi:hypothetical protein